MDTIKSYLQIVTSHTRKSISIQVCHDCTVKVIVPIKLPQNKISEILKLKENWISKKIEYFQKNPCKTTQITEYVNRGNCYYLGEQYKLKIIEDRHNKIDITENIITIYKKPNSDTENIITKWFLKQAKVIFLERVKINFKFFLELYQYKFPTIKIRKMKSMWGSMSHNGDMTLNTKLIHTPMLCIDYVIMHELCHLKHKNHSKKFYQLQLKLVPNYKNLKQKLRTFV